MEAVEIERLIHSPDFHLYLKNKKIIGIDALPL